jgi:hypothetical protein
VKGATRLDEERSDIIKPDEGGLEITRERSWGRMAILTTQVCADEADEEGRSDRFNTTAHKYCSNPVLCNCTVSATADRTIRIVSEHDTEQSLTRIGLPPHSPIRRMNRYVA